MSSNIWTRCAGASELRPTRLSPWRVVESQHQLSTRKLVDSAEEQILLEELIDRAKPPDPATGQVHYLLATPFRYPPLPNGSRFGTRHERGIWYASRAVASALAEVAYYRFVFREGTRADLGTLATQLTAFTVRMRSKLAIDLTTGPFATHRRAIASPTSYASTHPLGTAMREAGVELFTYPSARDPGGVNVGALTPTVFGGAAPREFEAWSCVSTPTRVELAKHDYVRPRLLTFEREQFLVNGVLPTPGVASP